MSEAVPEAHWELRYTVDMTATRHVVEVRDPRAPLIFTPLIQWVLVSHDELLLVSLRRPPRARAALTRGECARVHYEQTFTTPCPVR